ncbi:MFS transporter [Flavisphingomonas formosensis]|uniref:MFS transporter n=1 Tax=Flavisphingomonas formosensis TaxID=861534 RepID=UPI0012F9A5A7|nr:MFS transporter [Sphingomonas formosensis]
MQTAQKPDIVLKRAIAASIVGNTLEWYDFFLYATAAALVFGDVFFPVGTDPLMNTLASFAGYAVGFAARPLGGLIFGHVGDRVGRKASLFWTLAIMGISTFLIGLLPSYARIGIAAPAALVVLRILQGIAAGGEWGGGVLLITENASRKRAGFFGALSQTGVGLGFVLSSFAFYLARQLSPEDFMNWGWRLPFLVSIAIFAVGIYIRLRVNETSDFAHAETVQGVDHAPLATVLREHPKELLVGIGARLAETCGSHLFVTFALAFGKVVGVPVDILVLGVTLGMLVDSLMMPVFGWLSDLFGRRRVYAGGAVAMALFAYPFFLLLSSGSTPLVLLAFVLGNGLCHAAMIGVQPAMFSELFPARVRYSGLAMAHEVSSLVVGLSPVIATALYAHYRDPVPVAGFLVGVCAISLLALAILPMRPRADRDCSA